MALTLSGGKKNHRRYPGTNGRRPDLKKLRQEEAVERMSVWQALTPSQQLAELDRRGMTATKQRAKIAKLMEKENANV